MSELKGSWSRGTVRGKLKQAGWGAAQGFPGIELHPDCDDVDVQIFESNDLPQHWHRLDAFEGAEYKRCITTAQTEAGPLAVSIYILADSE